MEVSVNVLEKDIIHFQSCGRYVQDQGSHGYSVECYPTKAPGDARRIVRECRNEYLYICCAGGDGTLDEVVSGMMENRQLPFLPIGYIPSGTTNDFAGTLGIPSDMKEAAEVIASGKVFNWPAPWESLLI